MADISIQRVNNNDTGYLSRKKLNENDELLAKSVNGKVDRSEMGNIAVGLKRYQADVAVINDLPMIGNEPGDGRKVLADLSPDGLPYIWLWDGSAWGRTPFTAFPKDIITQGNLTKVITPQTTTIPANAAVLDGIRNATVTSTLAYEKDIVPFDDSVLTIQDKYIGLSGVEVAQAGNCCSDFIKIPTGATAIVLPQVGSTAKATAFFEAKINLIKSIGGISGVWNKLTSIPIPARANYVRMTWLYGDAQTANNAIAFTGYFIVSAERENILRKTSRVETSSLMSKPQHIFPALRGSRFKNLSNTVYNEEVLTLHDQRVTVDGVSVLEGWSCTDFVPIPDNISSLIVTLIGSASPSVFFYGVNKTMISYTNGVASFWQSEYPIDIPAGAKYVRANWLSGNLKIQHDAVDFKMTFLAARTNFLFQEKGNLAAQDLLSKKVVKSYDSGILTLSNAMTIAGGIVSTVFCCSEYLRIPKNATHVLLPLTGSINTYHLFYNINKAVVDHTLRYCESGNWNKKMMIACPPDAEWLRVSWLIAAELVKENADEFSFAFYSDQNIIKNLNSQSDTLDSEVFGSEILTRIDTAILPNGNYAAQAGNVCSELIELKTSNIRKIFATLPGTQGRGLNCYDSSKTLLGTIYGYTGDWSTVYEFMPLQGTKYIAANWLNYSTGIKESAFAAFQIKVIYNSDCNTFISSRQPPYHYIQALDRTTFSSLGVPLYALRIPFADFTNAGTLIIGADVREGNAGDQTLISIGIARSTDKGKTFQNPQIIIPHTNQSEWDRAMDATILVDRNTGRIFVFCHRVPLKEMWETTHAVGSYSYDMTYVYSDDDGLTWSEPISLKSLFGENVVTMFGGVGNGITMENGTLVLPIQCKMATSNAGGANGDTGPMFNIQSGLLYSTDHGDTWVRSESLLPCYSSECNIVESQPGELVINARGYIGKRRIFKTRDLGKTWERMPSDRSLLEPSACQGAMHKVSIGHRSVGLFGNPRSSVNRLNYTVQMTDDYIHFKPLFELYKNYEFGYSCIFSDTKGNPFVAIERQGGSIDLFDLSEFRDVIF
ncbi:exo-alpha-sialidase [Dysgonomonas capnocytophagoides]|uniref:exo-alpha-sialidase n=1 Tax=Dysgonomonas capnocytophagoides TaxID=45254 RepID=A0A4Y8KYL2_9BACT|nr:sialidase family protein [Dysgonomonas capnocytophagoides]TFD95549.1 exo-alpha-sialidase [Dysgonomonas capnocytophagoides]